MKKYLLVLFFVSNILLGQGIIEKNSSSSSFTKNLISENAKRNTRNINISEVVDTNYRTIYFHITIGIAEPLGVGCGYQLNENWGVALKWGAYWLSGGVYAPKTNAGFGIKLSRSLDYLFINNINCEVTLFNELFSGVSKTMTIEGYALDINVGNEKIIKDSGNFIWAIGLSVSSGKHSPPLYLPQLKIGFNIN